MHKLCVIISITHFKSLTPDRHFNGDGTAGVISGHMIIHLRDKKLMLLNPSDAYLTPAFCLFTYVKTCVTEHTDRSGAMSQHLPLQISLPHLSLTLAHNHLTPEQGFPKNLKILLRISLGGLRFLIVWLTVSLVLWGRRVIIQWCNAGGCQMIISFQFSTTDFWQKACLQRHFYRCYIIQ